jgi:hypothetical protein
MTHFIFRFRQSLPQTILASRICNSSFPTS